jgi:hypothetical protein
VKASWLTFESPDAGSEASSQISLVQDQKRILNSCLRVERYAARRRVPLTSDTCDMGEVEKGGLATRPEQTDRIMQVTKNQEKNYYWNPVHHALLLWSLMGNSKTKTRS